MGLCTCYHTLHSIIWLGVHVQTHLYAPIKMLNQRNCLHLLLEV